ncbi:YqgE/AlgH family protein [Chitinophaga agrisoli]|uniref:YqgE/AlgH family protein n=1 Tax=Chitinophaga agrisoli TaxID=2607653 RepID=A0A5B2VIT9_9BACT|nr:YqgE/AlgH family protein [Chitinophaga agrisoli]KAA2238568.1 YqgE/AlgH family protein [Chitinophaga agrisoli]
MKQGLFLHSTDLLDDSFFEKAVIFIAEYNEKGAMGFVVNRLFPRRLNELEEFKQVGPFPVYVGGPVDQEHIYFVHRRPDVIAGGSLVAGDVFLGGDFKDVVRGIRNGVIGEEDVKVFIGYCGWDGVELEEEVEEGSWEVMEKAEVFGDFF